MAKLRTLQSALNAGELSPMLWGRPDILRYQHGLERCRNAIPLVMGGASRRPGSRFVRRCAAVNVRLLPFVLSLDGALVGYVLELSAGKIRFYSAETMSIIEDGESPVEIVVPYLADELRQVRYGQHENTLYLIHPYYPPARLQRVSDVSWIIDDVPFVSVPFQRPPGTEQIVMRPSSDTGNITISASEDFFEAAHVGHRMTLNNGLITLTAVANARSASAEVAGKLPDQEDGTLQVDTTTITLTKLSISAPCQVVIKSSAAAEKPLLTTVSGDGAGAASAIVSTNNLYRVDVTTVSIDPDAMAGDMSVVVVSTSKGASSVLATTTTGGGVSGVAVAKVRSAPQIDGKQPDKDWQIEAWTERYGYPATISFFEQRMLLAASPSQPATVWGSRTGKPLEFFVGTLDDDPMALPVSAVKTTIHHLVGGDHVFLLTGEQELTLSGSGDESLKPTGFQIKNRASNGAASDVRPLVIGGELVFCPPAGDGLHVLRYALERDGYITPNMGDFAEHLISEGGGIVEITYTRRPVPAIWAVTAEGSFLCLVYDPPQEVYAWSRHDLGGGGKVRSALVIPDSLGVDRIWLAVEMTVDGETVTNVQIVDSGLNTDCAVTATDAAKTEWDGLDHLEGMVVDIVADGYVCAKQTVVGGAITLPEPAASVEIGLPYTTTIKDLPPYFEGAAGAFLNCIKARVFLHQSKGCVLNGERIPFRQFGDSVLDSPIEAFTGWKDVSVLGSYSQDGNTAQVEIIQDQPLPLTVLAIAKEIGANG